MSKSKLLILLLVAVVIGSLLLFAPREYLSLEFVQSKLGAIEAFRAEHPVQAVLIFAAIYIISTAASIPGALILTLSGGAIFGFFFGSVVVLISATIGATIAFLLARYLFDDMVQNKMGERLTKIRENFRKEGALYLFSMRLVPVFPFFAINLLMGLTSIKTSTYALASFIGMAPGTMAYINAGTQLGKLESVKGLLSPGLIISFVILAAFPYVAKFALKLIKSKSPDKSKESS